VQRHTDSFPVVIESRPELGRTRAVVLLDLLEPDGVVAVLQVRDPAVADLARGKQVHVAVVLAQGAGHSVGVVQNVVDVKAYDYTVFEIIDRHVILEREGHVHPRLLDEVQQVVADCRVSGVFDGAQVDLVIDVVLCVEFQNDVLERITEPYKRALDGHVLDRVQEAGVGLVPLLVLVLVVVALQQDVLARDGGPMGVAHEDPEGVRELGAAHAVVGARDGDERRGIRVDGAETHACHPRGFGVAVDDQGVVAGVAHALLLRGHQAVLLHDVQRQEEDGHYYDQAYRDLCQYEHVLVHCGLLLLLCSSGS